MPEERIQRSVGIDYSIFNGRLFLINKEIGEYFVLPAIITVCYLQPFFAKIFGVDNVVINYLDDLVAILFLFLVVIKFNKLIVRRGVQAILICYGIFLILGIISGLIAPFTKNFFQIITQILVDIKLIVFTLFFFLYVPSKREFNIFDGCLKFFLLLSILICCIEVIQPNLYISLFSKGLINVPFEYKGIEITRYSGLFWHPFQTAMFAGFATFYFIYLRKNIFFGLLSFIQLLITVERQEIISVIVLLGVLYVYAYWFKGQRLTILFLIFIFFFIVLFLNFEFLFFDKIVRIFSSSQFVNSDNPRSIVYVQGFDLAKQYFPLGVGFGNFGGFSAVKYDSNLYHILHFEQYWWFKEEDYLTDTYYPHLFAEAGFLGFIFYFAALYYCFRLFRLECRSRKAKLSVVFLFLFLIVVAITSPVLNNPLSLCFFGFILSTLKERSRIV